MDKLPTKLLSLALTALMLLSACTSIPSSTPATDVPAAVGEETGMSTASSSPSDIPQNPTSTSTAEQPTTLDIDLLDTHESDTDYTWDEANVVDITLADGASSADSPAVRITGNQTVITASGTYRLAGKLSDGQVLVESTDDGVVRLILNGVEINNSTSAPVYIKNSEKTVIVLADGTQNVLTDTANYVFPSADEDEPKATLFANDDLTIYGAGTLRLAGQYNDAISTDDGLLISGANIIIQAVDDGIRGKDYLVIKDANLEIVSGGDGLKSDNDKEDTLGQIQIYNTSLNINSVGDVISAEGAVTILSGVFTLDSGDSSFNPDTMSAKAIKGLASVVIEGGTFLIDAADDAVHSNGDITVNGGDFTIASGDDGIHADLSLTINGGTIEISDSYEGLESQVVTINGGEISLLASDDGINAAGGADGSGMNGGWGMPGGQAPWEQGGDTSNYWVRINGGKTYVNARGDGIDSNGSIEMTGGVLLVDGPTMNGNGPLDYMGTFNINGGTLVAVGSLGMAQAPSASSTQPSIFIGLNQSLPASTLIYLQTSSGQSLLTYAPAKEYQSVLISSPDLQVGESYSLFTGGSSSGEIENNLYLNGEYQPGTELTELKLESIVTTYGTNAGPGGGGGGGTRPDGGGFPPGGGGGRP